MSYSRYLQEEQRTEVWQGLNSIRQVGGGKQESARYLKRERWEDDGQDRALFTKTKETKQLERE